MLIVQKYGGSSVADAARIQSAAEKIAAAYREGHDVIVVLSAQGDTTDDLIARAGEINPRASRRELDMLLAVGEQISVSLMAMQLEKMRVPAVSLAAWQYGLTTDSNHGAARIRKISGERIRRELDGKRVVLAAGFQGVDRWGDVTTLGRGGSDTTAVALAAALHADRCQIYTDVEGVYTADPRKVPGAKKLDVISYDEMLELAALGSQVLHNRCVELAKRYHVELEVLSSSGNERGTLVREAGKPLERMSISGVTKDADTARITVYGLRDEPGVAFRIFHSVGKARINVGLILQSGGGEGRSDISFTVAQGDAEQTLAVLEGLRTELGYSRLEVDRNTAKVSIVGSGLLGTYGVAASMFEALSAEGINIQMISTSEIKISVLVKETEADRAVAAVHEKFFG